jgi:AAA domain
MTEVPRPAWLTELIAVARQSYEVSGRGNGLLDDGEPKLLGRARRDPESDPGWFWVDPGSTAADTDQEADQEADEIDASFLAPAQGPRNRRFQVLEAAQDGSALRVRVASHAPAAGLFLWVSRGARAQRGKALLDGLSQIRRFDLVARFGQGRADVVPAAEPRDGLNADQARGRAACLAPGVQLIWGPPGTGKTRLIAAALQDLIGRGQSVLLVSGTAAAVDDAVCRTAADLDPAPGVMVRAGMPQATQVAADPRVSLERMILDRLDHLNRDRADVEGQIAALRAHPDLIRRESAQGELAGFDAAAYHGARQRIENHDLLTGLHAQMLQVRERAAASLAALATAQAEYEQARRSWVETARPRQHLKAATDLEMELGNVARECDQAIADVMRLQADRERIASEFDVPPGGTAGRGRRRELKRLVGQAAEVSRRLDAAEIRRREAERKLASFSRYVAVQIEGHLQAAEPITDDVVARRRITLRAAAKQLRRAWDVQQECIERAQDIERQITRAEQQPEPTAADRDLVVWAGGRDLARKPAELAEVVRKAGNIQAQIGLLEERDDELRSQLARERGSISRGMVRQARVVATTLATLLSRPELNERDYDHVLVDEAAAASLPEIVYAVSRGTEGATLLGDFLQNGPVVGHEFEKSADPAVQRWLHQDCFALFGLHDPRSAQASPACATLSQQYLFGPTSNDLANAVAYRGLLRVADPGPADGTDQEIVLVDVDGLDDGLSTVRPSPDGTGMWWPAGALISAALAAWHGELSGQPVGVITPYACQQALIRGQLTDAVAQLATQPKIEIGTPYRFQGRGFGTVIFDLAENGDGWVARAGQSTDRLVLDGLRVFNVAITRARRRLYVIASGALLRKSATGPLFALRWLVEQNRVRVVHVAEILGRTAEPADDPIASDIWHALREFGGAAGHPPACPQCGQPVREVAQHSSNGVPRLQWVCRGTRDDRDCGWAGPSPDRRGAQ